MSNYKHRPVLNNILAGVAFYPLATKITRYNSILSYLIARNESVKTKNESITKKSA